VLLDLPDEVCCSVLQCVAVCCSVLQCVAVELIPQRTVYTDLTRWDFCCLFLVLQSSCVPIGSLLFAATSIAVCRSLLQCVSVCCSGVR